MAAPEASTFPWHSRFPRLGTEEEFLALRRLIADAGYTEEGMCGRLGVQNLAEYTTPAPEILAALPMANPLDGLIRLFFDSVFVDEAALAGVLPPGTMDLLDSLALLARDPARPGMCYATAAILPSVGMLTVCDRGNHAPDGTRCELPPDVVYPAIFDTTHNFIRNLPTTPCEAMLEIGTGTGIAAMLGTSYARHVWATDIAGRSVRFAEFNRQLAGLPNMTVLEGDMYAPVEGLTFDRIVTHPPYIPAKRNVLVFRDGGEDGEQILRRVIEGLPRFLRPGGRYYSLQLASDRKDETFEQRIRRWLGPQEAEFDVLVAAHSMETPREFLARAISRGRLNPDFLTAWLEMWKATQTEIVVYGSLLLERHPEPRKTVTRRVQPGDGYDWRHLEWLLSWETALRQPDHAAMLLHARPALPAGCELQVVSRVREGRFWMEEFRFQSRQPFRASFHCDAWLTDVVAECDGQRTWGEHLERAKAKGAIAPDVAAEEFAGLLGLLVIHGIVTLAGWLPPEPSLGPALHDKVV